MRRSGIRYLGLASAALGTLQVGLPALGGLALRLGDRERSAAHVYGFIKLIFCHVSLYCTPSDVTLVTTDVPPPVSVTNPRLPYIRADPYLLPNRRHAADAVGHHR